ncbi:hypothetical protein T484DRAFT_1843480, partial [Baffinella frigidus]
MQRATARCALLAQSAAATIDGGGLSCLRALIVHHPSWRDACLARLLGVCVAEDEAMRSPAIRLVANKLFTVPYVLESIQDFAVTNLRKACQAEHGEGSEMLGGEEQGVEHGEGSEVLGGEEQGVEHGEGSEVVGGEEQGVVRHYMHLFLALCAQRHDLLHALLTVYVQRHDLLHALLTVYVQAAPKVRSAIQGSITDMIKAVGPESPTLLAIFADFPPGAEVLVLAFVRTLTEGGDKNAKLIDAIK